MTRNKVFVSCLIISLIVLTINIVFVDTIMPIGSFVKNENTQKKPTMQWNQTYGGTDFEGDVNIVQTAEITMEVSNDYIGSRITKIDLDAQRAMGATHVGQIETPWTVMVYMVADNDLSEWGLDDLNEMECIGSIPGVMNVIVFADFLNDSAKTYYIDKDDNMTIVTSTELTDTGLPTEPNMGNPDHLATFIDYSIENFPADNYFLILWNHGYGIHGFGDDNSHSDNLTLAEITSVISTRYVDILGFDACHMGMLEIAHEFKDYVNVFIGSEEIEPYDGWPYDIFLQNLSVNSTLTPNNLAALLVSDYIASYMVGGSAFHAPQQYATLSALNCSRIDRITAVVDDFAQILHEDVNTYYSKISLARARSEVFPWNGTYIDLYSFALEMYSQISDTSIRAAAQDVMDEVSAAVIGEPGHVTYHRNAHGLSIHFGSYDINNSFTTATAWDEFILAFLGLGSSPSFAIPISTSGDYCGYLSGAEDGVFYSLCPAKNVSLILSLVALTNYNANFDIYLYSQDLTIALDSSAGEISTEFITYDLVDGQTYYLKVDSKFGHGVFYLSVSIDTVNTTTTTTTTPTTTTTTSTTTPSWTAVLLLLSLFAMLSWRQRKKKS